MRSALDWLKDEIGKFLWTAIFFAVTFCVIVLTNKLLVRGSDIEIASFGTAIVGGLIVAKVLLSVDLLPFVDAFPGKPLVYNIIWKTPIYIAATLVFRYLEPVAKSLFAGMGAVSAHGLAIQSFTQPIFWATEIWIALLLGAFVTMQELARSLGKDKMRLIFFGL